MAATLPKRQKLRAKPRRAVAGTAPFYSPEFRAAIRAVYVHVKPVPKEVSDKDFQI